jgi:hypothetical protein
LPGVRKPVVYATVEVGGTFTLLDTLNAHSISASGAEMDVVRSYNVPPATSSCTI